jgi:hypothetical protein
MEQAFSLIQEHGADDNDVPKDDEDVYDDDDDDDYVVFRSFHYAKFLSSIFSLHDTHTCLCLLQHASLSTNRRRRMCGNKLVRVCKEVVVTELSTASDFAWWIESRIYRIY